MTEPRVPEMPRTDPPHPVRMIPAGLNGRETRDRMECLRIAADAGGSPDQVISRAEEILSYVQATEHEETRSHRWTCLRMASQVGQASEYGDDYVAMAKAFEAFLYAPAQAQA